MSSVALWPAVAFIIKPNQQEKNMQLNKVFLGGTCGESKWRGKLMPLLQMECFDPVVADWTPECMAVEETEKEHCCNVHLYVITSETEGVFSIAEAVQSSLTKGKQTIFHVIPEGFSEAQLKHRKAVVDLITSNGGVAYIDSDIERTACILNYCYGRG